MLPENRVCSLTQEDVLWGDGSRCFGAYDYYFRTLCGSGKIRSYPELGVPEDSTKFKIICLRFSLFAGLYLAICRKGLSIEEIFAWKRPEADLRIGRRRKRKTCLTNPEEFDCHEGNNKTFGPEGSLQLQRIRKTRDGVRGCVPVREVLCHMSKTTSGQGTADRGLQGPEFQ